MTFVTADDIAGSETISSSVILLLPSGILTEVTRAIITASVSLKDASACRDP